VEHRRAIAAAGERNCGTQRKNRDAARWDTRL